MAGTTPAATVAAALTRFWLLAVAERAVLTTTPAVFLFKERENQRGGMRYGGRGREARNQQQIGRGYRWTRGWIRGQIMIDIVRMLWRMIILPTTAPSQYPLTMSAGSMCASISLPISPLLRSVLGLTLRQRIARSSLTYECSRAANPRDSDCKKNPTHEFTRQRT